MRWLGLGVALIGAGVAACGLAGLGPSPHHELLLGIIAGALGGLLAAMDVAFGAYLRRLGVQDRHVRALRSALQAGTDQGLAAIERLRSAGLEGKATIVSVVDTGSTFNQRPEVDLELEIEVEGRAPYRVRQRHLVPRPSAERLRAGEVLRVKIDPDASERMLIEWQSA